MPVPADALFDRHVLLIGRPPLSEYLGFVASQTREGSLSDYGSLASEWRLANDRVRELERLEAGIADDAAIQPPADSRRATRRARPGRPARRAISP